MIMINHYQLSRYFGTEAGGAVIIWLSRSRIYVASIALAPRIQSRISFSYIIFQLIF